MREKCFWIPLQISKLVTTAQAAAFAVQSKTWKMCTKEAAKPASYIISISGKRASLESRSWTTISKKLCRIEMLPSDDRALDYTLSWLCVSLDMPIINLPPLLAVLDLNGAQMLRIVRFGHIRQRIRLRSRIVIVCIVFKSGDLIGMQNALCVNQLGFDADLVGRCAVKGWKEGRP